MTSELPDTSTSHTPRQASPEVVLLAAPRGWCAGVDRAIQVVERALELHGPPVYVRGQIVHNRAVLDRLRNRGAVFITDESKAPPGSHIVFSAHGVAPSVRRAAAARGLNAFDATCPLVTKVHVEARRFAERGYTVVVIGHAGHEETVATMGEAADKAMLVETQEDVECLEVPDPERIAWVSQTTLAVADTAAIVERLRRRFPALVGPRTDDICYATTNRQVAVAALAERSDLVLVVGSANSSNSRRLVEVAEAKGTPAHLVDSAADLQISWLVGARVVGVTAGASAPDDLVEELLDALRARGARRVEELKVAHETVRFMLPPTLRSAIADA